MTLGQISRKLSALTNKIEKEAERVADLRFETNEKLDALLYLDLGSKTEDENVLARIARAKQKMETLAAELGDAEDQLFKAFETALDAHSWVESA